MKVIHKGKVLYPDNSGKDDNSDEISEQLLDISSADLTNRRKKPSLVVMGLRQQKSAVANNGSTYYDVFFSIARWLTPRQLWNMMTSGCKWTFHTTASILGGICLFVRSLLYPPQAQ